MIYILISYYNKIDVNLKPGFQNKCSLYMILFMCIAMHGIFTHAIVCSMIHLSN